MGAINIGGNIYIAKALNKFSGDFSTSEQNVTF